MRKHLTNNGITPEDCEAFDLFAHGPIYPQVSHNEADRPTLMALHKPFRNQVGAMEKLLCDGLKKAGYTVMNTVNCRWVLSADGKEKWEEAKQAFQKEFPRLK